MGRVTGAEVFGIDWTDLEQCKDLARKLGKGQSVIKYEHRVNYNITHTSTLERREITRWGKFEVVYTV